MATYRVISEEGNAPFLAGADLTAAQYHFVATGSVAGEVILATGASDPGFLGILQNSPSAGQEAIVKVTGFSKVQAQVSSGSLTYGKYGTVASDGKFNALATAGSPAVGRWLSAAVTSGCAIGEVMLLGFGLNACPGALT